MTGCIPRNLNMFPVDSLQLLTCYADVVETETYDAGMQEDPRLWLNPLDFSCRIDGGTVWQANWRRESAQLADSGHGRRT